MSSAVQRFLAACICASSSVSMVSAAGPGESADAKMAAELEGAVKAFGPWQRFYSVSTGIGYRDNVLLSAVDDRGTPFIHTSGDITIARAAQEGAQVNVFFSIEDNRFLDAPDLEGERFVMGQAQVRHDLNDFFEGGLTFQYLMQDQVLDISEDFSTPLRLPTIAHSYTVRPDVRRYFNGGWWMELGGLFSRQELDTPLDSYWEQGARIGFSGYYGRRSQWEFYGQFSDRRYDTRTTTDSQGFSLPGTRLSYFQQEYGFRVRHVWDDAKHFRTTSRLNIQLTEDSGGGYFDYQRVQLQQQLQWKAEPWDITVNGKLSTYRYPLQPVGSAAEVRERLIVSAGVNIRRNLGGPWIAFLSAEWEDNLSNEPLDEYRSMSVMTGVTLDF